MSRAVSAVAVAGALAAAVAFILLAAGPSIAAEPTPTAIGGDPRSAGEGPGLVGAPLVAIGAVVAIALVAALVTTVWVRVSSRRAERDRKDRPTAR